MRDNQLTEEEVDQIVKRKLVTGKIEEARARKQKRKENFLIFLYFALFPAIFFIGESKIGISKGVFASVNTDIILVLYFIIVILSNLVYENKRKVKRLENMLEPHQKVIYNSFKNNP